MGKKIGKALLWLVGLLLALVVLVTIVGFFLPTEHAFRRTVGLSQPPEVVWAVIADCAAQPSWRPDLKSCERLPNRDGHEAWRLTDTYDTAMTMTVTAAEPPTRLVQDYAGTGGGIVWEFVLAPESGGTQVTLTERNRYSSSFFRFVARAFFGDKFARDFLYHLAAKFGAPGDVHDPDRE